MWCSRGGGLGGGGLGGGDGGEAGLGGNGLRGGNGCLGWFGGGRGGGSAVASGDAAAISDAGAAKGAASMGQAEGVLGGWAAGWLGGCGRLRASTLPMHAKCGRAQPAGTPTGTQQAYPQEQSKWRKAHVTRSLSPQDTSFTAALPAVQAVSMQVQPSPPDLSLGSPGHQAVEGSGAPVTWSLKLPPLVVRTALSHTAALHCRAGLLGTGESCGGQGRAG
jgi:hypothetical protein